jgi:hypothetical protein
MNHLSPKLKIKFGFYLDDAAEKILMELPISETRSFKIADREFTIVDRENFCALSNEPA